MATSKLSPEERILRKRNAARLRQQRCRARKKQALMEKLKKEREDREQRKLIEPRSSQSPKSTVPVIATIENHTRRVVTQDYREPHYPPAPHRYPHEYPPQRPPPPPMYPQSSPSSSPSWNEYRDEQASYYRRVSYEHRAPYDSPIHASQPMHEQRDRAYMYDEPMPRPPRPMGWNRGGYGSPYEYRPPPLSMAPTPTKRASPIRYSPPPPPPPPPLPPRRMQMSPQYYHEEPKQWREPEPPSYPPAIVYAPMPKKMKSSVESKEEEAIDAILSLKKAETSPQLGPKEPPTIVRQQEHELGPTTPSRPEARPASMYAGGSTPSRPQQMSPGFYLSMRFN